MKSSTSISLVASQSNGSEFEVFPMLSSFVLKPARLANTGGLR